MSAQQPFNPRLVFGLIVAGILAFAVLLLLLAYGGGLGSGRDGRPHALSTSAVGFKGLVQLVGAFHHSEIMHGLDDIYTEDLVVIALEPGSPPDALARLREARQGRATLIILPKWATVPDRSRRGWVRALAPGIGAQVEGLIGKGVEVRLHRGRAAPPAAADGENILQGLRLPVPRSPQLISGGDLQPLVALPGGGALVARIGDQPHYVVADPDLLNNHGLRTPAAARAALRLIESLASTGSKSVKFDLTVNGLGGESGSSSLLRLAFEPPFLVMTLALVIAALLAGLHGAFRFGPARREARAIAFGKAALVENSAGLIRLAGREANLGGAYADVVRQEAARAASAAPWLQGEALDAYLNRLGRPGQPSFSELAERVASAPDRHALMAAARTLIQWKKEIIR